MDSPDTSADFFANSSNETVEPANGEPPLPLITDDLSPEPEYPPAPIIDEPSLGSDSFGSLQVDGFLCEVSQPPRLCCPFCILDFGFDTLLKEHIKESHGGEVKRVVQNKANGVEFYQCPFCQAKFYGRELLPKHIIRKHELCVVNMFSGFSPEKYVYCRFCPHKTMRKHYKLLIIHIEKKHADLFEKYVIAKYSSLTKSLEDLCDDPDVKVKPVYRNSPGLSNIMMKLSTNNEVITQESPSFKSILKPQTSYPLDSTERMLSPKGAKNEYANLNLTKPYTRRKLRFNLPDCSDNDKENKGTKRKSKAKWKLPLSKKHKRLTDLEEDIRSLDSEDSESEGALPRQFKCGLCSEAFDTNVKLVDHLSRRHKGFKLQARYECGQCQAKFYRNSYLVRHCWHHHAPLCLKTPKSKKGSSVF